jgi:hypothetical protein
MQAMNGSVRIVWHLWDLTDNLEKHITYTCFSNIPLRSSVEVTNTY